MVTRVLTLLTALIVLAVVFSGEAQAARKTEKKADANWIRHLSEDIRFRGDEEPLALTPVQKYPAPAGKGPVVVCNDAYPEMPDANLIQHDQIGHTWYDFQKNGSMGRMISVTPGGYRHFSWMFTDGPYGAPNYRYVDANCKNPAGQYVGQVHIYGGAAKNAGYINQDHMSDGKSVVIYHRTAGQLGDPITSSMLSMEDAMCSGQFNRHWDLPDSILNAPSGENGMWPKCEVKYDDVAGKDYVHVVMTEGNTTGGVPVMIAYQRCYLAGYADTLYCQAYVWGATQTYALYKNTNYSDPARIVANWDSSCSVTPVPVVSPVSERVSIVYMQGACDKTCDYLNDIAYIESMVNGDDWINGTAWPPTVTNLTNYGCGYPEEARAYRDLNACYDYNDSLHIVWSTVGFPEPGSLQPGRARLWHWSKMTGTGVITSAIWGGTNPGGHNANIAKMSISAKDPMFHPGGDPDSVYLFCIWTQFDTTTPQDNSDAGYTNGELYGVASNDGGWTWGNFWNLTQTKTPDCTPGNCVSEHWSSLAQNMHDGNLHIMYVCDKHPGTALPGQDDGSVWVDNPMYYMHLGQWEVGARCEGAYEMIDPGSFWRPALKVPPGGSRTLQLKVENVGNLPLHYTAIPSSYPEGCIHGLYDGELDPREYVNLTFTVDGTGACDGKFIQGTIDLYYCGEIMPIPVHAVVADDYYECPIDPETFDTVETSALRIFANANGLQWIHDISWWPDTVHEVFSRGGPFVATSMDGNKVVGRWYGENDWRAGVRDGLSTQYWEYPDDYDCHILSSKDVFIHYPPTPPYIYHCYWWWWEWKTETMVCEVDNKIMVINHITVSRHDPPSWWPVADPPQGPYAGHEDTYVGMMMDIDCPYDTMGSEKARNFGGYDEVNHIVWQHGFDYTGQHPGYNNYYAGMALADPEGNPDNLVPYGAHVIKNNYYLYPQSPWGWDDEQFYDLAATAGPTNQDSDSLVDRSIVLTARHIPAGYDPDAEYSFFVVEAATPNGLYDLQAMVDTARALVKRMRNYSGVNISQIDASGFPVIEVYVDVLDVNGAPLPGLTEEDFCVFQDLEPVNFQVTPVDTSYAPVAVCLVVDVSGSMAGTPLEDAKEAAKSFVRNMDTYDRAALVSYANCVDTVQSFTNDTTLLITAINSLSAYGMTAMFDGFWLGVDITCAELGSKATIGFTDGQENNSDYCWPPPDGISDPEGWQDDCDTVVSHAAACGFPIFSIGLGPSAWPEPLMCLAQNTGGKYYYAPTAAQMESIYVEIKNRLLGRYLIVYASPDTVLDGTTHQVVVCEGGPTCEPCDTGYYSESGPPLLTRTPETIELSSQCQPAGQDLVIEATAIDHEPPPVQIVLLFYRVSGTHGPYSVVVMTQVVDSLYSGIIPGWVVPYGSPGVDYYLMATDGEVTVSDPPENPHIYPYQISICPNEAPEIASVWYPADSCVHPGEDFQVMCQVFDFTDWVDEVRLFYREVGDILYDNTTMESTGGDTFSGAVPGSYVTAGGADYYIRAVDNHGLASYYGTDVAPNHVDTCGPPIDCGRSYSDPCLAICPLGDIPFRVYLRDSQGRPAVDYSYVCLDFSNCPGITPCPTQSSWPLVPPEGPSDTNGMLTFYVRAGGCDNDCQVPVLAYLECGVIEQVSVKTVDVNADSVVRGNDWQGIGGDPCNDYNCNGEVNYWDVEFFRQHIAHSCVQDPCVLFSQDLIVTPDTLLPVGEVHDVRLLIQNFNAQPCSGRVDFFRAGFGEGSTLQWFAGRDLPARLASGDTVSLEVDFVVPGPGSGHILSEFSTDCCAHTVDAIFNFAERMCPPDSMVYVFPIHLATVPTYIETLEYLPDAPGWHWFLYETGGIPDSIAIVTPDSSILGITGGVALYFYDHDWNLLGYRTCEVRITLNSGDANSDCEINLGDAIYMLNYLFKGDDPPEPLRAGDVNCDCVLDLGDVVYMLNYLFKSGVPPVSSETCECGYKEWFPGY